MTTGYEDIEKLTTNQNQMLDNALTQQQDIVNKQTEQNVAELERQKAEVDKEATKTNQGLYAEYKKTSNPYGVNAEQLYSRGLGNSGYAETTQTNLYNTYQKNVTDTVNNAQKLKSDFDFEINKARQNGDITKAQNALELYKQKLNLLTQEYELRNNREQYLYQKDQDALAQSNWEKEYAYQQERDSVSDNQWQQAFDYNKGRDEVSDQQWKESFDYQKGRDQVSDQQWQQSFDYNKGRDEVSDQQWKESFDYQKGRDQVSDQQWQQSFDYNKSRDEISDNQWQQSFDYQKGRDAVSDSQWQQTMNYQKQRDAVSDSKWAKEYVLSSSNALEGQEVSNNNNGQNSIQLSENGQRLLTGLTASKVSETSDSSLKDKARDLIYYDQKWGRITEEEAKYLFEQLGL